jgi:hypoxanthine phosphoribosyltransferase
MHLCWHPGALFTSFLVDEGLCSTLPLGLGGCGGENLTPEGRLGNNADTRDMMLYCADIADDTGCAKVWKTPPSPGVPSNRGRKDARTRMWRQEIQQILISETELYRRIQALGNAITDDYRGKDLVFVPILQGALMFSADLARSVDLPLAIDCMALSSYGDRQVTSGRVRILKDLSASIADKHVLIIEDIIDTGLTLQSLWHELMARHPADLHVCTLLNKRARRQVELPIRYTGFEIPDVFVVGYGLDYQQRYRNLPFIGTLRP